MKNTLKDGTLLTLNPEMKHHHAFNAVKEKGPTKQGGQRMEAMATKTLREKRFKIKRVGFVRILN